MKIETDAFASGNNLNILNATYYPSVNNTSSSSGTLDGNSALSSPSASDEKLSIMEQLRRNISHHKFRDWTLGVNFKLHPIGDNAIDSATDLDSNDNQNTDFEIKNEPNIFAMTDSMLTFFQGSAILLLAALVIILIVVICQNLYKNQRTRRLRSKKVKSIKKVFLYPVKSSDVPELEMALEAAKKTKTTEELSYDPFTF